MLTWFVNTFAAFQSFRQYYRLFTTWLFSFFLLVIYVWSLCSAMGFMTEVDLWKTVISAIFMSSWLSPFCVLYNVNSCLGASQPCAIYREGGGESTLTAKERKNDRKTTGYRPYIAELYRYTRQRERQIFCITNALMHDAQDCPLIVISTFWGGLSLQNIFPPTGFKYPSSYWLILKTFIFNQQDNHPIIHSTGTINHPIIHSTGTSFVTTGWAVTTIGR